MLKSKLDKIFELLKEENYWYQISKKDTVKINNKINSEMQEVRKDYRKREFQSELEAAKTMINTWENI